MAKVKDQSSSLLVFVGAMSHACFVTTQNTRADGWRFQSDLNSTSSAAAHIELCLNVTELLFPTACK